MADLMRKFEAADTDGCAAGREAGKGGREERGHRAHALGPLCRCWAVVGRLPPSQLLLLRTPGSAASQRVHLPPPAFYPCRNGVIDRQELRALLERVGGGSDDVPLVSTAVGMFLGGTWV